MAVKETMIKIRLLASAAQGNTYQIIRKKIPLTVNSK